MKVRLTDVVLWDGIQYGKGDELEVDEASAQSLIDRDLAKSSLLGKVKGLIGGNKTAPDPDPALAALSDEDREAVNFVLEQDGGDKVRAWAKAASLDTEGSDAEVAIRVLEQWKANIASRDETPALTDPGIDQAGDELRTELKAKTVEVLKGIAAESGVELNGTRKDEIIEELVAHALAA